MGENTVPIDESAVQAELDALEGQYIPGGHGATSEAQDAPGAEQSEPPTMDWTVPAGLVVMILDKVVAPGWELEQGEKELLHSQLVQTLTVFFPSVNVDPRIVALCSLGGAIATIAARRVDLETGRIKPLRPAREHQREHQEASTSDRNGRARESSSAA